MSLASKKKILSKKKNIRRINVSLLRKILKNKKEYSYNKAIFFDARLIKKNIIKEKKY
jgi:hypothetical protein